MAGIFRDNNGTRRIHFHAPDGKRKTIRLGKCSQKVAEAVKVKIEALVTAIAANQPADAETAKWVSGLDAAMANKLAAVTVCSRSRPGRIRDAEVLHLLKLILKASGKKGVPQGGVISPLLSNLYLTEVDKMLEKAKEVTHAGKWTRIEYARFADDLVILIDGYRR